MPTRPLPDPGKFALPADLERALEHVVEEVLRWAGQQPDVEARLGASQAGLLALEAQRERALQARLEAVVAVRATGASYDKIAELAGLTKGRVPQLLRQAEAQKTRASPEGSDG